MGCDYYIIKLLKIIEKNGTISYIEISRERCYYPITSDYDSDDPEFLEQLEKKCLIVKRKPILLFENDKFLRDMYYYKYSNYVTDNIDKIYKIEQREKG